MQNKGFWLITSAIFSFLFLPLLFQKGMFMDGVTYAAIANNMANNIGSFWTPLYTSNYEFWGHPPMAFGLESILFKLLGDGFYVEKIYSTLMALISAFGISLCWRLFKPKAYSWSAIIFWLITPIVFWSYQNNMLENTMTVFCLFSTYLILKSFKKQQIIYLFLGSLFLFGGILSKGVVALFPIGIPFIYFIIYGKKNLLKSVIATGLLLLFPILFFLIIFNINPASSHFISEYLNIQVIASLQAKTDVTTDNQLMIMWFLLSQLLPVFIILITSHFIAKKNNIRLDWNKDILLYVLIGFAASLPIIISVKQREFYLVPSIPFFAIALGYYISPLVEKIKISTKADKWIKLFSISLIALATFFSISKFGNISRNEDKLSDAYTIADFVSNNSEITIENSFRTDHLFYAQLARIGNISLVKNKECKYLLLNNDVNLEKENFEKVNLELHLFDLYQKTSD